jgi:multimeric flavodoxin WrbA
MPSILVLYHSQQNGNTAAMAKAIAEGAAGAGAKVTSANTNEERLDIEQYRAFDGAAFGSPDYYSYVAGGFKVFIDDWYIARGKNPKGLEGKPYVLFYSHGGGGAVKKVIESLCKDKGEKVGVTIESRGTPSAAVLEQCRKAGAALAKASA